jgi:lipopolysaccharide export LptBFGC system permease protein LptF
MLKLIPILESWTPIVQAIDCLLMLLCGVYCLRSIRRQKNTGLTILAIACFLSAVILLGFFLSAAPNGKPLFSLTAQFRSIAYLIARLLALFELPLFIIGIVLVARANKAGR